MAKSNGQFTILLQATDLNIKDITEQVLEIYKQLYNEGTEILWFSLQIKHNTDIYKS